MKFLANENVPYDAVAALRETGHDIVWVRTDGSGSCDEEILSRAVTEERVLITFDKDFGEMAFHSKLPAKCGIILFRIPGKSSSYIAKIVDETVKSRTDWAGHFTVVEEHRIRMRTL